MKKIWKWLCAILAISCAVVLTVVCYWNLKLPDSYKVEKGEELHIATWIESQRYGKDGKVKSVSSDTSGEYRSTLRWCGIFPVKEVTVSVVDASVVTIGGTPFGIKLYTDGVLIVSLSEVVTEKGKHCPSKECGLKTGDLILSINGKEVFTNKEVASLVENSGGKPLKIEFSRNNIVSTVMLQPVFSKNEKKYKAGLWVRDSSAGIGTVTFYDAKLGVLAGLGHPICDVDTGEIIPISGGEIVPARIYSVAKSSAGSPGELRGGFEKGRLATLDSNNEAGVYGRMTMDTIGDTYPVALKQEIKEGEAHILTTLNGTQPQWYTVRIKNVNYKDNSITRNMLIEVTDAELLKITGGIVQGMSGSPIVQNGKLIGAVTHVLVNDPTKGYAIFAENMLAVAQNVANKQLKAAS